jgi:hypothetical protein
MLHQSGLMAEQYFCLFLTLFIFNVKMNYWLFKCAFAFMSKIALAIETQGMTVAGCGERASET